jgi:excisionase family DNA binding protein
MSGINPNGAPRRPPLTLPQAAAYLNCTERWLRRAVQERRLAYAKLGHLLRFFPDDLDDYLDLRKVARRSS